MALYRVTSSATLFGQKIQNVLHFHRPDAPEDGALTLAHSMIDDFYGQIKFLCNNAINWNLIRVDTVDSPTSGPLLLPTNFSGAFSSSVILWGPLCAVFQIKTAVAGRVGRGRFYISGVEPAALTSGVWGTTKQLDLNSVASSLKTHYVGSGASSGYQLGVMPRSGTTVADFKPATDIVGRNLPGTQGRRNIGRGN